MNSMTSAITLFFSMLALVLLLGLLLSFPAMLLWNYCLVPAIPAIQEVGWLQMWGIIVLSNFLFKGSSVSNNKN